LLKGFTDGGEVRLVVSGTDEVSTQRLRSVFLLYPDSTMLRSPPASNRKWWQAVGFVWLAWWMDARNQDAPPEDGPKRSNIVKFRK